jgi:hypothetical protein
LSKWSNMPTVHCTQTNADKKPSQQIACVS